MSRVLPARIVESYLSAKQAEWDRFSGADDKLAAETGMYFERY